MGAEEEQDKNMAPAWRRMKSFEQEEESQWKSTGKLRRKRWIQCCGCLSALMLIMAVIIIILIFTVFRIKDATLTLNSITFEKVSISLPTSPPPLLGFLNPFADQSNYPSINMTMLADLSVKNPNIASFKFNNATTNFYYNGSLIGHALSPPGNAKAYKTFNMNITVEMFILSNSSSNEMARQLWNDMNSGSLTIDTYTSLDGRVNVLNIFKRYMTVKMSCFMEVSLSSSQDAVAIKEMDCHARAEF